MAEGEGLEGRLVDGRPDNEAERKALGCLVRLRGEGKSAAEIAAGLEAETGLSLPADAVARVLERVAGPVPEAEGGDPDYFSGHMGGG